MIKVHSKLTSMGTVYYADSSYKDKDILKSAGFWWHGTPGDGHYHKKHCEACLADIGNCWWTASESKALHLIDYFDQDLQDDYAVKIEKKHQALAESKAIDAEITIPSNKGLEYMPFQKAGVNFAVQRNNTLLADEMGLGKTIQAIGYINWMMANGVDLDSVLLICPKGLKINWAREFNKWLVPEIADHDILLCDSKSIPMRSPERPFIHIINYDILVDREHKKMIDDRIERYADLGKGDKDPDVKKAMKQRLKLREGILPEYDLIIADEAHAFKKKKSARSKLFYSIKGKRNIYLTGTPIENRPIELFPLIQQLDKEAWNSEWTYGHRYCGPESNGFGTTFKGASNLGELNERLRSTIMIRRKKSEVMKELPPKRRQVIDLEVESKSLQALLDKEKSIHKKHKAGLVNGKVQVELLKADGTIEEYKEAVKNLQQDAMVAFGEMATVRREIAVSKVPQVIEYLQYLFEGIQKVVLFCHHREVGEMIHAKFEKSHGSVRFSGSTPDKDRQRAVDMFQENEGTRLFVGSMKAAGVGITLTASNTVVFSELDWVPATLTQAEDRCHRIGQEAEMVGVHHLVLDGSLDAYMAQTVIDKQDVIDRALGDVIVLPEPEVERNAGAKSTRWEIEEESHDITPDQINSVHEGLKILASFDTDGATIKNYKGFNAVDTRIGRELSQRLALTPKQAILGRKILLKYSGQLGTELLEEMG